MADVRARLENDGDAGEHVDDAILLHVAPILDHDFPPIAANRRAGPDVDVAADDHVAGDGRVRVNERATRGPPGTNAVIERVKIVIAAAKALDHALDDRRHALPHADAHRAQRVAAAASSRARAPR